MVGKLRNRLTLLAVAVAAGACGRAPVSDALEATMHQAGANGRELGEALGHYSAPAIRSTRPPCISLWPTWPAKAP